MQQLAAAAAHQGFAVRHPAEFAQATAHHNAYLHGINHQAYSIGTTESYQQQLVAGQNIH